MGRGTATFGTLTCQLRGPLTDSSDLHRVLAKLSKNFNVEALMSFSVGLRQSEQKVWHAASLPATAPLSSH
ncbi:hypothetical protein EV1_003444 [Malus domestica]